MIRHKRKFQPLSRTVMESLKGISHETYRKKMEILLSGSMIEKSPIMIKDDDDNYENIEVKKEEEISSTSDNDDDIDDIRNSSSSSLGIQVLSFNKPEIGDSRCSNVVEIKAKLRPPYHNTNDSNSSSLNIFFYLPRSTSSPSVNPSNLRCIFSYWEPNNNKKDKLIGPSENMIMAPISIDMYQKEIQNKGKDYTHHKHHHRYQRILEEEKEKNAADAILRLRRSAESIASSSSISLEEIYNVGCVLVGRNDTAGIGDTKYWIPPGNILPPIFLRDEVVESISISYGYREGEDVCYHLVPPSFENICGGISLYNSSHIMRIVEEMGVVGNNNNILKMNKTAFGVCHEIFTIYGNVTLRRDKNLGGMVSFKGARDVRMIYKTISETLGKSFMEDCMKFKNYEHHRNDTKKLKFDALENDESSSNNKRKRKRFCGGLLKKSLVGEGIDREIVITNPKPPPLLIKKEDDGYDGFFGVHMAVVTACLGKRLTVYSGSTLETHLQIVLGSSNVSMISCIDDDNNAIKIKITNWQSVIDKSNHINDYTKKSTKRKKQTKNTCVGDNTISITAKGSVIARFSWDVALSWDESVSEDVLSTCQHLCNVLRECC